MHVTISHISAGNTDSSAVDWINHTVIANRAFTSLLHKASEMNLTPNSNIWMLKWVYDSLKVEHISP